MTEIPAFIIERTIADSPLFTADDVAFWPDGLLEHMLTAKVIADVENAQSVTCDSCGLDHVECVEYLPPAPGGAVRAFINCPSSGRVSVPLSRLRQWRLTETFVKKSRGQQEQRLPQSASKNGVPKRSWTQPDLDAEISKYKAQRASTYPDLVAGVRAGRQGAKKSAQDTYGRNAIVRALGVRSPAMVTKSPEWQCIAKELGLRNQKSGGGRSRKQRIAMDIALEEQAQAVGSTETDAAIRRETTALINRSMPPTEAEATVEKLQRGDISDDDARELVEIYADQEHDSQLDKVRQNA